MFDQLGYDMHTGESHYNAVYYKAIMNIMLLEMQRNMTEHLGAMNHGSQMLCLIFFVVSSQYNAFVYNFIPTYGH